MHDDDNDSKHKLKFLIIKVSSHSSFYLFYHKFLLKASSWLVFYGPWFTHYLYYYYILFSLQSGLKTKKIMLASTFIKNCSLVLLRNKRDIRSSNSIYNLRYFPRFLAQCVLTTTLHCSWDCNLGREMIIAQLSKSNLYAAGRRRRPFKEHHLTSLLLHQ